MKKEKKKDGLQRLQARTTHGSGAGGYPLVLRGDAPLHRCAGLRIRALVHPHPARRKKMPGMVDGGCARACTARRLHLRSAQGMLWLAGTSPLLCTGTPGGAPARCPPLWAPKIMPLRPAPVEHKFLSGGPWGMLRPNCAGGSRSTQRQPGWTSTGCSEHHVPRTIAVTRALHKSTAGLSPCALWGRGGPDSARSILTPTAWPFSAPCACNSGPGSALWTPAQDWAGIGPLPPCAYAYAPCASSAQALRKLCVSLAQALRKPCAALHKPRTSFLPPPAWAYSRPTARVTWGENEPCASTRISQPISGPGA